MRTVLPTFRKTWGICFVRVAELWFPSVFFCASNKQTLYPLLVPIPIPSKVRKVAGFWSWKRCCVWGSNKGTFSRAIACSCNSAILAWELYILIQIRIVDFFALFFVCAGFAKGSFASLCQVSHFIRPFIASKNCCNSKCRKIANYSKHRMLWIFRTVHSFRRFISSKQWDFFLEVTQSSCFLRSRSASCANFFSLQNS